MKSYNHRRRFVENFLDYPYLTWAFLGLFCLLSYQAWIRLDVRQFPFIPSGVIRVVTTYPGADAKKISYTISEPLEKAIAQAESFDYIISTSSDNISVVEAHLKVGKNIDVVFPSVLSAVQATKKNLPSGIDDPILTKTKANSISLMYIAYTTHNPSLSSASLYSYLDTVVRPQILGVRDIGTVEILGAQNLALRIYPDFLKMSQHGLNISDLAQTLSQENIAISAGFIENFLYREPLVINSQSRSVEEIENLVLKDLGLSQIQLKDVAQIVLGSETEDSEVYFNGQKGVFLAIDAQPNANALTVLAEVKTLLSSVEKQLPDDINQHLTYDASRFIADSIWEVEKTFLEATVIVIAVIYFTLGSMSVILVPIAAIIFSLMGVAIALLLFQASLNLLTLLAMILSIGLVVDDAILVIEHAVTVLQKGRSPQEAVKEAIRHLHDPLITMTVILAIAYLPLIFVQGISGYLFREFALTLASAVLLSGVIALVLSPLMTSYALKNITELKDPAWMVRAKSFYQEQLQSLLIAPKKTLIFTAALYPILGILFIFLPAELAPKEDQGFAMMVYQAPENSSLSWLKKEGAILEQKVQSLSDVQERFFIYGSQNGPNSGFGGFLGKPIKNREHSMEQLAALMTKEVQQVPALTTYVFTPAPLPGPDGLDFQCVIYAPLDMATLVDYAQKIEDDLKKSGYFPFIRKDTEFNKIQHNLDLKRDFLASLGISASHLGMNLALSFNDFESSKFLYQEREIDIRIRQKERYPQELLSQWQYISHNDTSYRLEELARSSWSSIAPHYTHYNQMNSVTIEGVLFPFATAQDAIDLVKETIKNLDEPFLKYDFKGPIRTYQQEGGQLLGLAMQAFLAIGLFLLGLFHSVFDSLLILSTIPLALVGALMAMHSSYLLSLFVGLHSLGVSNNIYTQLSLLTLFGLISKHGILMVDQIQKSEKKDFFEAVLEGAESRFRPIIMTTLSMIVGVIPLVFAQGSGSVCRYHMGVVIFFGLGLGTCFTLFVFPALYYVLGKRFSADGSKKIDQETS